MNTVPDRGLVSAASPSIRPSVRLCPCSHAWICCANVSARACSQPSRYTLTKRFNAISARPPMSCPGWFSSSPVTQAKAKQSNRFFLPRPQHSDIYTSSAHSNNISTLEYPNLLTEISESSVYKPRLARRLSRAGCSGDLRRPRGD